MFNKSLKSVHITNYYHKNSGGISYAYDKLLEAANRHKRFVRLIVPGEHDEQEEINEYARIYHVATKKFPFFDKRYRVMQAWNTYMFDETPIRKILFAEKPDVIEIAEKYSLSLLAGIIRKGYMKPLNRPLLVHFTCERMDDNMRSFVSGSKPFMWFSRRVMGNYNFPMFDYHVANSVYTAQELLDAVSLERNPTRSKTFFNFCWRYFNAARTPIENRVFVNQCGVDSELFNVNRKSEENRRGLLRDCGFPPDAKVLLYAGRVSPEKNVALLADLMKLISKNQAVNNFDFRLLIVGDGPQTEWLKNNLERNANGKHKLLGFVKDKEKLANIYANSDVFVHPNPREPFGIAPLEAMASGVPLIAPNSGGVLSYANTQNAWLTNPRAENFCEAALDTFKDEAQRESKIAKGIETARAYTWETSTAKLFGLYDEMYEHFNENRELYACDVETNKMDFADVLFCNPE